MKELIEVFVFNCNNIVCIIVTIASSIYLLHVLILLDYQINKTLFKKYKN